MSQLLEKPQVWVIAPLKPDTDRYEHKFEYCDILVVGSGPAGLASALAAAT